ncbi:MAG: hypothetical protein DRP29_00040 [Thermodesulfobacteriota bacterium]|nr:MAG: hypothetical protein DRP29_00040 [Thermodesulfobacteriota bacterium]
MIYILNTLVIPIDFDKIQKARIKVRRISAEEAKKLLEKEKFVSAIGHKTTAQFLSELLGMEIEMNRRTVFMEPGDKAIHLFLKERLPEGKILSEEEMKSVKYWLVLSEIEVEK